MKTARYFFTPRGLLRIVLFPINLKTDLVTIIYRRSMSRVLNSLCSFCNIEDETTVHLFSECHYVMDVWREVQVFFRSKITLSDLTPQSAILGWYEEKDKGI